jgi:predicted nucleotidyltransferase
MMKNAIYDKLKRDLPQVMQRHPAILSAYVFGSVAMGFEHRRSDVDIAVRVDAHLKPDMIEREVIQFTGS